MTGQALTILPGAPVPLPFFEVPIPGREGARDYLKIPTAEKLSFELWVRQSDEYAITLVDLSFASGHERFWGLLPSDEKLYSDAETGANGDTIDCVVAKGGRRLSFSASRQRQ